MYYTWRVYSSNLMQSNDNTTDSDRLQSQNSSGGSVKGNPATEMIRQKISQLYSEEPTAKEELEEIAGQINPQSKHQRFMEELSTSGLSLSEIQTAWHNYYQNLDDAAKHEVWQEFYKQHKNQPQRELRQPAPASPRKTEHRHPQTTAKKPRSSIQTVAQLKKHVGEKVRTRSKLSAKQHFQSLLFGVSIGSIVLLLLLFGFFNERFIAPFITPSRQVSSTPIIIDPSTTAVGPEPKIIIPKINVEIPVVYDEPSVDEKAVQKALERGVVHYATTPSPGEKGNSVIFGHSSNNILNQGKYKFAFVLLNRLEAGDTFYLNKDGTRYVYKVYEKKIVKPDQVSVLGDAGKPASASLITCDPPGTSLNRLVVIGEQISPDPTANKASTAKTNPAQPEIIPSNAPSLWSRFWDWLAN